MKSPYKQINDFEGSFRRNQLSHGLSHGLSHNCLIIVTCRPYEHLKRLVTAFPQRTRYLGRAAGVPTLLTKNTNLSQTKKLAFSAAGSAFDACLVSQKLPCFCLAPSVHHGTEAA